MRDLTGLDWVLESGLDVVRVIDLIYAKQSMGKSEVGAGCARGFRLPETPRS